MALHYRDEEVIYVQASSDRVTVIFSTTFREETDRVFGKVFLQVRALNQQHGPLSLTRSAFCRSSSMLGDCPRSRLRRRSFTPRANRRSRSDTSRG